MPNHNMHSIKRAARKEAWYGDSYNPFRKVRSSTWGAQHDEEQGSGPNNRLSQVQTEPLPESPRMDNDERAGADHPTRTTNASTVVDPSMTAARTSEPGSGSGAASTEKESENFPAASDDTKTQDGPRRRLNFFHKDKEGDDQAAEEEVEKKRPWWKGKDLYHAEPFTIRNQVQRTVFNSWVNVLLLCAPVGIALNYVGVDGKAVFVVNFIAIIPLAGLLSFATEEIALHVGESLGGLLNASFGNAVEMIVAIIALAKGEIVVVQTSLIGSILSNLLLVMGMCFFFGGLRRTEQYFNQTVAQTSASLLALAIGSIIIPTCFDQFSNTQSQPIAALSRGTAVILLVVYGGYLFFQLKTHSAMFNEESKKVAMRPRKGAVQQGAIQKAIVQAGGSGAGVGRARRSGDNDDLLNRDAPVLSGPDEPEEPQLHIAVAWATLAGATAIVGLCAEFMVDGISAVTNDGSVSVEFVGLILLPIVGNAAEHATAVTVACKDKMDLAIGVAVGSSMQVALLLIPLLVVIGWIMGNDCMTLDFDGFQVAVMFVAVLLVNYVIGDGRSSWLEGMILQCLYIIIAVCAWYYPQSPAKCGNTAGNSSS